MTRRRATKMVRTSARRATGATMMVVAVMMVVATFAGPSQSAGAQDADPAATTSTTVAVDEPVLTDPEEPAEPADPADPADPDGDATDEPATDDGDTVDNSVTVTVGDNENAPSTVLLLVLISIGSFLPGLLMVCTTFPRFLIVLSFVRQALGLQTTPPNQVLVGLALFLTLLVMGPVFSAVNEDAVQPALDGDISTEEALEAGWEPIKTWMLDHTRTTDVAAVYDMVDQKPPADPDDVGFAQLVPAFLLSELKTAFTIGFLVWVPFLLIDLIVAAVLSALGIMMMPPVIVSLPIKLAVFVLVDGWDLVVGSVVRSVNG